MTAQGAETRELDSILVIPNTWYYTQKYIPLNFSFRALFTQRPTSCGVGFWVGVFFCWVSFLWDWVLFVCLLLFCFGGFFCLVEWDVFCFVFQILFVCFVGFCSVVGFAFVSFNRRAVRATLSKPFFLSTSEIVLKSNAKGALRGIVIKSCLLLSIF